jgi:hypothetical protein
MKRLNTLIFISCAVALSACGTIDFKDAEPERYASFDCEQLEQLAESYRPDYTTTLFSDSDDARFERRNESGASRRLGETSNAQRPYEIEQERDRRSIALAQRQKGCIA